MFDLYMSIHVHIIQYHTQQKNQKYMNKRGRSCDNALTNTCMISQVSYDGIGVNKMNEN